MYIVHAVLKISLVTNPELFTLTLMLRAGLDLMIMQNVYLSTLGKNLLKPNPRLPSKMEYGWNFRLKGSLAADCSTKAQLEGGRSSRLSFLNFSFFEKTTKICANLCGLLRKAELYLRIEQPFVNIKIVNQ